MKEWGGKEVWLDFTLEFYFDSFFMMSKIWE